MNAAAAPLADLHTHILPGVDDGAADLAQSLAMARAALADGIGTMAATPHNLHLPPGTDPAALEAQVADLQRHIAARGLPLRVAAGAELALIAALPQQIDAGQVAPLNHSRHLLLESPLDGSLAALADLVFQVQARGYICILAHPERSRSLARRPDGLRAMVERGALVQITAASLEGAFGRTVQEAACRLLASNLVHVGEHAVFGIVFSTATTLPPNCHSEERSDEESFALQADSPLRGRDSSSLRSSE